MNGVSLTYNETKVKYSTLLTYIITSAQTIIVNPNITVKDSELCTQLLIL